MFIRFLFVAALASAPCFAQTLDSEMVERFERSELIGDTLKTLVSENENSLSEVSQSAFELTFKVTPRESDFDSIVELLENRVGMRIVPKFFNRRLFKKAMKDKATQKSMAVKVVVLSNLYSLALLEDQALGSNERISKRLQRIEISKDLYTLLLMNEKRGSSIFSSSIIKLLGELKVKNKSAYQFWGFGIELTDSLRRILNVQTQDHAVTQVQIKSESEEKLSLVFDRSLPLLPRVTLRVSHAEGEMREFLFREKLEPSYRMERVTKDYIYAEFRDKAHYPEENQKALAPFALKISRTESGVQGQSDYSFVVGEYDASSNEPVYEYERIFTSNDVKAQKLEKRPHRR